MKQTTRIYAGTLRVTGEDLAKLPENLAIEINRDNFIARGLCAKSRMQGQATLAWTKLKKLVGRVRDIIHPGPEPRPRFECVPIHS